MPCEEKSFWTKTFDDLSGYIHTYLDAFDLETQLFGDSHGGFLARKLPEEGNGRKISDVSFKLFEEFFYDRLWNKRPVDEYADVIKNALEDLDCRNVRLDKLQKLVKVRFETKIHQHPTPSRGRFTQSLTILAPLLLSQNSQNDQVSLNFTNLKKETLYYNATHLI